MKNNCTPVVSICIGFVAFFLGINVVCVAGLHDWWPSLLNHILNDKNATLYVGLHYYTGPSYPFLLKFFELFTSVTAAPVFLGFFLALFLLISACSMLNSFAEVIGFDYQKNSFNALMFGLAVVLLIPARFMTEYLIVADYHTYSLILFCLAVNKALVIRLGRGPSTQILAKISYILSRIPFYIICALLFLNRAHEGLIFLVFYPLYFSLTARQENVSWQEISRELYKFLLLSLIFAISIFYFLSTLIPLPSFFAFVKYVIVTAPKSKGVAESGYLLGVLTNYIKTYYKTFSQIFIILCVCILLRVFYKVLKDEKITLKLLDLLVLVLVLFFSFEMVEKNKTMHYLINANNLLLLSLAFLWFLSLTLSKKEHGNLNYEYLLVFPLIGGHLASTSGIYNESFILFLLPSTSLCIRNVFPKIIVSRKFLNYLSIFAIAVIFSIFNYKFSHPRVWWLDNQPSIFSKREWMSGSAFEKRHPNLNEKPSYASSEFLTFIDGYCSDLADENHALKVISYPLSYFEAECKTKKGISSISDHFSLWYDVALLSHLEYLIDELKSGEVTPDYLILQLNPLSLFEHAKYYWSGSQYSNYPHFQTFNYLQNYGQSKMSLIRTSYLIDGQVLINKEAEKKLDSLREQGCFDLNNFYSHCESDFINQIGSANVTLVAMYKNNGD